MKTPLIVSVVLWAATVVRSEATTVQPEHKTTPTAEEANVTATTEGAADPPQDYCLDDWLSFRGKCYFLANDPENWRNAQSFCARYEGSLASVRDVQENQFLQQMVQTGKQSVAWIGGFYFEGAWRWVEGLAFRYTSWGSVNSTDHNQCLQLHSEESDGWTNRGCSVPSPFICQVTPTC